MSVPSHRRSGPRSRSRSSRRHEAAAAFGKLPLLGRLENVWPPLTMFDESGLEMVIAGALQVLEDAGLEVRGRAARQVFADAGALVDEETMIVRIGREIVVEALARAPAEFVLHARNSEHNLHIGGTTVNFGPVNGAPNIADTRGRRPGDLQGLRTLLRLNGALGCLHWQGGVVVEPQDIPVPVRHLHIYRAHIDCSDQVWAARGVGGVAARDGLEMCAIEHGRSLHDLARRPSLMIVTNVNSPRRVDEEILDCVMAIAEHGQCVVATPFTLMGAMAPITLAGALAQQTAEALGLLVLTQFVRPGAPFVLGGFTSNVDMRTGSPAFGTPEYVRATIGGAQIARRLGLPFRASAVNASPAADAQAAWETQFSLFACIMSHVHLINHAAGWLEGGLVASLPKAVLDAEMLRGWAGVLRPVEVSPESLALDTICETPPGGHFFAAAHTLARYQTAFNSPFVADWSNFENWRDRGGHDATQRAEELWPRLLEAYDPPAPDPGLAEELDAFMARREKEIAA